MPPSPPSGALRGARAHAAPPRSTTPNTLVRPPLFSGLLTPLLPSHYNPPLCVSGSGSLQYTLYSLTNYWCHVKGGLIELQSKK